MEDCCGFFDPLAAQSIHRGRLDIPADLEDDRQICRISSHSCFHGGNWILGGQLLSNQVIVDFGMRLTDVCWNTYASTAYAFSLVSLELY